MYEKILIPLDGSRVGEAALPVVQDLIDKKAPDLKLEVILLQVVPTSYWVVAGEGSAPVPYTEAELGQIEGKTNTYLAKTGKKIKGKDVTVKTMVSAGDAAAEIHRVAEESGVNLIAMSTHGRSGISRWAFGSVTDRVLRSGTTPVLTVRAPGDLENG